MAKLLNINKRPNKLLVKAMTILASIISLCGVAEQHMQQYFSYI